MSESIAETIEHALRTRYPTLTSAFGSGATPEAIADAEHELGVRIPDEFRAFLMGANGQSRDQRGVPLGIPVIPPLSFGPGPEDRCTWGEFLSLDQIVQCTKGNRRLSEYDPPPTPENCSLQGPVALHRNHIIFCDPGSGDAIGIDLSPPEKGSVGQIVAINHDPLAIGYLCNTFRQFVALIAEAILSDEFVYSIEDESFVPASEMT